MEGEGEGGVCWGLFFPPPAVLTATGEGMSGGRVREGEGVWREAGVLVSALLLRGLGT